MVNIFIVDIVAILSIVSIVAEKREQKLQILSRESDPTVYALGDSREEIAAESIPNR